MQNSWLKQGADVLVAGSYVLKLQTIATITFFKKKTDNDIIKIACPK
jgi:hypothetical protein